MVGKSLHVDSSREISLSLSVQNIVNNFQKHIYFVIQSLIRYIGLRKFLTLKNLELIKILSHANYSDLLPY